MVIRRRLASQYLYSVSIIELLCLINVNHVDLYLSHCIAESCVVMNCGTVRDLTPDYCTIERSLL